MRLSVRLALPAALGCIVLASTMLIPTCPTAAPDRNEAVVGNPPVDNRVNGGPAPISPEGIQQLLQRYRDMLPKTVVTEIRPAIKDMTAPLIQDGPLAVRVMPGSDFEIEPGFFRSFTWVGRNLLLWGRISGGSGSYSATWDPGDGSGPQPADVSNPNYVYLYHVYTTFGPKTAILRVTDLNTNEVVSASVYLIVDISPPAQQTRVNAAIEDGLRWLYLQQYGDGSWYGYSTYTALAVAAFELAQHKPTNPLTTDVYADRVRAGLESMIGTLQFFPIFAQPAGNPDLAPPFGQGVAHTDGTGAYSQGIMMLALALSQDPVAVAATGPLAGQTYHTILANMVDQLAFSQTDAPYATRGGWRYDVHSANYDSDNSAVQWASIGLEAAERFPWNITAAEFVKTELELWLNYSQCTDGCFGYTGAFWCNTAKTGSAIFSHYYIDPPPRDPSDPRVQSAISCLNSKWCSQWDDSFWPELFFGNYYAMYAVKKALEDYGIPLVGTHDWQDEFEKFLVKSLVPPCGSNSWHQITDNNDPFSDGQWLGDSTVITQPVSATAFALLILIPGVGCSPPHAVAQALPPEACVDTEICFNGLGSSTRPGREIQEWQWDYDNNGTVDATGPYVCRTYPEAGVYTVRLRVVDNNPDTACRVDDDVVQVTIGGGNHPPIPVPGGPYTACVGDTIWLNGCQSFDPDAECTGDSICEYLWDLDADGTPDYVTNACPPDTFLIFHQEQEQEIQLRVRDCQGALSDPAAGRVRVWSSIRELSIATTDIQLTPPGGCTDVLVTATIHAATQVAGTVIPPAQLELYIDDPTCSDPAKRMWSGQTPPLVDGETFVINYMWDRQDEFDHTVTVCIDPNQLLKECVETDNVATVPIRCMVAPPIDCSKAVPSVSELWPPNHKMVEVSIQGVTSSNGSPVTIEVTEITQDEPVNGTGDGNTTPDAEGIGTSSAMLRAERRGGGNGRIYKISFVATAGQTSCTGSVWVCVPHDLRPGWTWSSDGTLEPGRRPRTFEPYCVDDGQIYDSTGGNLVRTAVVKPDFGSTSFPNPFNPTTTIQYTLPEESHVRIDIYDAQGRRVRRLADVTQAAGVYNVQWDGRDHEGRKLASGVYLYRVQAGSRAETKRVLLVK